MKEGNRGKATKGMWDERWGCEGRRWGDTVRREEYGKGDGWGAGNERKGSERTSHFELRRNGKRRGRETINNEKTE